MLSASDIFKHCTKTRGIKFKSGKTVFPVGGRTPAFVKELQKADVFVGRILMIEWPDGSG